MRKVLPWSILLAVLLAAIPIASQFTPDEVARKLATWKTVAQAVLGALFIVSLIRIALLYFRRSKDGPRPATASQHDIQLFQRINDVLNDHALTFLADHDFHNDAHASQLEPITTISYWHGPNYIFNDEAIQKRWQSLFEKILNLSHAHGNNLTNSENNIERLTAWHLGFARNAQPPQAHQEIKELNDASADVYREFGSFAVFTRKRLGL